MLDRRANKRRLIVVFGMTTAYMLAEAIGGQLTGSLALLADAGHMLTDAGALGLALYAIRYAERPATPQKSFGYYRAEVIAAIGLVVNFVGMRLLSGSAGESLNVKAAYLEVLSDTLGSLGVIAASVIILTTGWYLADPIFGAAIGLFIIPRTWKMLKDTAHILMEGTPANINLEVLQEEVLKIPGVVAVHDVHVWTLTSGLDSMSGHVCVADPKDGIGIMNAIRKMLEERFGISHTTIQVEDNQCRPSDLGV